MSQDLREYRLKPVDGVQHEADRLAVTATVGPYGEDDSPRGAQITLNSRSGTVYARLSEQQLRDLVDVLDRRTAPDEPPTATGIEADYRVVNPDGSVLERVDDAQ